MLTETPFKTVPELFQNAIDKFGERPLFGTKTAGVYKWLTFSEFDVKMRKLRAAMNRLGIKKGDAVGVIANNSVEFALAVYASYGLGAVVVPMYEVQKPTDWEYILNNAQIKLLFVGTDAIKQTIQGFEAPNLKNIFVIRPSDPKAVDSMNRLIDNETELMSHQALSGDDIADIIYTSGTTGLPKGVLISHTNLVQDVLKTAARFYVDQNDRTLAFLPWAHEFGKTVELLLFPSIGAAIGLVESNRTISQNLLEVNPTVLVSVPKIFNKIYDTIHQKTADNPVARILFERTEALAQKSHKTALTPLDKIQQKILDRVVGSKVREAFGTSLRFCISGGAALSEEIANFFIDFGVQIYEGYGMTETSPVIAVNSPKCGRKVGSAGKPLEGIDVRIDVDKEEEGGRQGEIIVSGPIIMQHYFGLDAETAEVITENGEFRTGDMGYIDEDGFVWITGRVKEQYKLENGKYVVPSALEKRITDSLLIEACVIFGAGMPYNVTLILPSKDYIDAFKAKNHLESATNKEIENDPRLHEELNEELKKMCEEFRGYEKPRKFMVTLDPFTIENGMMTPALKIKRREVEKRYGADLKKLYKD